MKLSMTPIVAAALAASASASLRAPRHLSETTVSEHEVDHTEKVMYSCTVTSTWSSANHPVDYPSDAHISPPVLIAHSGAYKLFTPGQTVSPGVQMVAETGDPEMLKQELMDAGDAVMSYVVGVPMFFEPQPDARKLAEEDNGGPITGRSQTLEEDLVFTPDHTFFSGISMLAPSPDWFTASHGTQPVEGDFWLKSFKYETMPYDAGTDSGTTFAADDLPTDPAEPSAVFSVDNAPGGIFLNPAGDAVPPVMTWECSIASVMYKCEFDPDCDGEDSHDHDGEDGDGDSAGSHAFVGGVVSSLMAGAAYLLL